MERQIRSIFCFNFRTLGRIFENNFTFCLRLQFGPLAIRPSALDFTGRTKVDDQQRLFVAQRPILDRERNFSCDAETKLYSQWLQGIFQRYQLSHRVHDVPGHKRFTSRFHPTRSWSKFSIFSQSFIPIYSQFFLKSIPSSGKGQKTLQVA